MGASSSKSSERAVEREEKPESDPEVTQNPDVIVTEEVNQETIGPDPQETPEVKPPDPQEHPGSFSVDYYSHSFFSFFLSRRLS